MHCCMRHFIEYSRFWCCFSCLHYSCRQRERNSLACNWSKVIPWPIFCCYYYLSWLRQVQIIFSFRGPSGPIFGQQKCSRSSQKFKMYLDIVNPNEPNFFSLSKSSTKQHEDSIFDFYIFKLYIPAFHLFLFPPFHPREAF